MRKVLILTVVGLALTAPVAAAQERPSEFDAAHARVHRSEGGQALTGPSREPAAAVVARFLREHGKSDAVLASLREAGQGRSASTGVSYLRMEQQVGGLRVAGAYLKAALDERGQIVHLIDNLAEVPARGVTPARIDEARALRVVLAVVHPQLKRDPAEVGREDGVVLFDKGTFFYEPPRVERLAIAMESGALKAGFRVQTWTRRGNLLHETLVGGDGRVLDVELRTNADSYNVFPEDPGHSVQGVVSGPGNGNTESPAGWVFPGSQRSIDMAGNNVDAYLDRDANNAPDPGGATIGDGNFVTTADLTSPPIESGNQEVAVQNLFYLNNVIHDTLYRHGFTEAAGNFQEDNFGKGGVGGDSVRAEAQDGLGTDNANFATPSDGKHGRMQMYLWTGKGTNQVVVNTPAPVTYRAQGAAFGPALSATGVTGDVVLVNDGTGTTSDACEAVAGRLSGKIALIDRGTCPFTVKVKNAQVAGALAAIVVNNAGDSIVTMGGTDATVTISSVFIGQADGNALKAILPAPANVTARLTVPAPLQRDGDLDSDIVFHEYGHGLTWRMIGRMSGPMSGAIGEGMSDTLAIIMNDDDVVGEYAFDEANGIRSAPYDDYPRTYGDVAGTEVHFDGEVYGAIGWLLYQKYLQRGLMKDDVLDDIVDGMNFTPARPSFEDMRDGILQSVALRSPSHECLVWDAFAHYGVGVGARGRTFFGRVFVRESFVLPPECSAP